MKAKGICILTSSKAVFYIKFLVKIIKLSLLNSIDAFIFIKLILGLFIGLGKNLNKKKFAHFLF